MTTGVERMAGFPVGTLGSHGVRHPAPGAPGVFPAGTAPKDSSAMELEVESRELGQGVARGLSRAWVRAGADRTFQGLLVPVPEDKVGVTCPGGQPGAWWPSVIRKEMTEVTLPPAQTRSRMMSPSVTGGVGLVEFIVSSVVFQQMSRMCWGRSLALAPLACEFKRQLCQGPWVTHSASWSLSFLSL